MRSIDYFRANPVFTHAEYVAMHTAAGRSVHTCNNILAQNLRARRLIRLQRGLYATVMPGVGYQQTVLDPYLIATKLKEDAVLAYHAALQFHGKVYSIWNRFHYMTCARSKPKNLQNMDFIPVQAPVSIRDLPDLGGGTMVHRYAGGIVRVATLERTLVDVLDAPEKAGGWEEIWRSLEMVEFFDLDAVIDYALKLGSSLTVARVGFYLDQHREALMLEDQHLDALRSHIPSQPRYFDTKRESGRFIADWNLVVPAWILERRWEEVL